jgi:hypothetical protein
MPLVLHIQKNLFGLALMLCQMLSRISVDLDSHIVKKKASGRQLR